MQLSDGILAFVDELAQLEFDGNSLGSQTGYATRMSAKMRVGLVVKV
jgi:hypothetical protein